MSSGRRDAKFIEDSQAAPVSEGRSRHEWEKLVDPYYLPSFKSSIQDGVRSRLQQFQLNPDQPVLTQTGTSIILKFTTLRGLCRTVLTLYTLGHPLHRGSLFYPVFNKCTREAVEKKIPFHSYSFKLEYCLIDLVHKKDSASVSVLYRASNSPFTYRVGDTFRFSQFTSTSKYESEARKFLQPGGIVFEIRNARALKMEPYSQYPLEREYLIHAFDKFVVDKISVYRNETRVVISKKR